MIGSLMSRMADAEKLSIPQLNQAVKNGTIPAYVGVPLIQEKMKAEQAAKAMVAQTQAQPPLARQVMEQADMMSGLEKLRSNLPEEGFAGGGIVAFAEGGETQPAQPTMSIAPPKGYTFDQATGQYDPINQGGDILSILRGESGPIARLREIMQGSRGYAEGGVTLPDDDEEDEKSLFGRLMAGITSLRSNLPESYEAELAKKGQTPASARKLMIDGPKKGDYVMPPLDSQRPSGEGIMQRRGGHKYEDIVIREAERIGLDPNMAIHVLYKETGNLKNPETVRSKAGAIGVMQLMPKTAKQLGVDPLNPEENIRGGVMYLKQMYDKYQDPTLAFAAYNAGPGRVDKALRSGQGIAALPRETQNYIRMAGGGIVAFSDGGLGMTNPEFGGGEQPVSAVLKPKTIDELFKEYPGLEGNVGRLQLEDYLTGKAIPPESAKAPKPKPDTSPLPAMGPTDAELGRNIPAVSAAAAAPEPYKEPPPDSGLADIRNLLKQRMEESGKQKRIDAYLSLLQTGLGMMGGSSPFAAVNIGQGAATGVAAQMAARKSQIADENAILTGQLGLSRAELYEKTRRDALRQRAEEAANLAEYRKGQGVLGAQKVRALENKNYLTAQRQFMDQGGQLEIENRYKQRYGKNWRDDANHLRNFNLEVKARINELAGRIGDSDIPLSTER